MIVSGHSYWWAILGWLLTATLWAEEPPVRLPFIRPVWLDTRETPAVLGAGSWSIIPYAEFQKTWQKAQLVADTTKQPWLIDAAYHATLEGVVLRGTAELRLHNAHPLAAWARLRPWSMVLVPSVNVNDVQVRADEIGKSLLALIPPGQTQSVKLPWEVTGEERQGGTWFSMQLPACPLATLSLSLPAPLRVEWPAARQHVSGPFPIPGSALQRWDLQLGGQSRQELQFVIKNRRDTNFDLSIETKIDADFILGRGKLEGRYELDAQRWHDRLRTLVLDFSHATTITSLQLKQLDSMTPLAWQTLSPTQVRVALPDTVDQRTSLVAEATWKVATGERVHFPQLSVRGGSLTRCAVRVAWEPTQQLTGWAWGSYAPQPMTRDARIQGGAEMLTLLPQVVAGNSPLLPPSAMLEEKTPERSFQQDQWWQLGRKSQLLVQCQTQLKPRETDILSWLVPTGWKVAEVVCKPATSLLAWTALPGMPLQVELEGVAGKLMLDITLVPEPGFTMSEEPATLFMPMLKPLTSGRWNGHYAITLDRTLQPPSVSIIQAPGQPVPPPSPATGIWTNIGPLPDWCWQLPDLQATGSLVFQNWPASITTRVQTALRRTDAGMMLRYQMKLSPLAGRVVNTAVRFSSPVSSLDWKCATSNAPAWSWKQTSPTQGELQWEQPLEKAVELNATLPWKAGDALPLLIGTSNSIATLTMDQAWKPEVGAGQLVPLPDSASDGRQWNYDVATSVSRVEQIQVSQLKLIKPALNSRLDGDVVYTDYVAGVPPHTQPLSFQIIGRGKAEVTKYELNGVSQSCTSPLIVHASNTPQQILVRFRTPVTDKLLWSTWTPAEVEWSVAATPVADQDMRTSRSLAFLAGFQRTVAGSDSQVVYLASEASTLVWMPSTVLYALAGMVFLAGCWLCHKQHMIGSLSVVLLSILAALLLPTACWPVGAAGGVALVMMWAKQLIRGLLKSVALFLAGFLVLTITYSAEPEKPATVLVYLLPGETNKLTDARVMVPAALWKQMQKLSDAEAIGPTMPWWVKVAHVEGERQGDRIKWTARWLVETTGTDSVEIPWLPRQAPLQVLVDNVPVQPSLLRAAFGIQQFSIRVAAAGQHRLELKWEQPVQLSANWQSVALQLPGAPFQTLRMKGVPDTAVIKGVNSHWTKMEETKSMQCQAGCSREVSLLWPVDFPSVDHESSVEIGVLWEHRLLQSTAHAILTYHIDSPTEELALNLPRHVRVKSLNMVGEVQAIYAPQVRRWKVQSLGEQQRLSIQLQRPVSGTVHLLLELPWQRNAQSTDIPLVGVEAVGIEKQSGFVAYLADGLEVKPTGKLEPVHQYETTFARPWLPSLASLPATAFTRWRSNMATPVMLHLTPISMVPLLQVQTQLSLLSQEVVYRFNVEVAQPSKQLAYLKAEVPAGWIISDVVGDAIASWQQSRGKVGEMSTLLIWLSTVTSDKPLVCSVIVKRPWEQPQPNVLHVPLNTLVWEGNSLSPATLTILNERPDMLAVLQMPAELVPLVGPWLTQQQVGAWSIPAKTPPGARFIFQQEARLQPKVQAMMERLGSNWVYRLTMTAPSGSFLPGEFDMVVSQGNIEEPWQVEAGVLALMRPSRAARGGLQWTIRLSQPVASLKLTSPLRSDNTGNPVPPQLSFPAWPQLVVEGETSPAESR